MPKATETDGTDRMKFPIYDYIQEEVKPVSDKTESMISPEGRNQPKFVKTGLITITNNRTTLFGRLYIHSIVFC